MPQIALHLSHFAAMVVFALLVSIVLAGLARRTAAERIRYALWTLLAFLLVGVGIAWLMYPFSR